MSQNNWNKTKNEKLLELKCHHNGNVFKTKISPKQKCHQLMALKMKCHQNKNVTKTDMSPKLKCHWNWNVTKTQIFQTEMSWKLKCHKNSSVTKTEKSPKMKYH